ncbi:MAG TPA: hypothetical protein VHT24_03435 [Pseudacidobacterium sp.]|jgi:hypothetical protein|nr:hypothetical protein [Pseudacidobacterium sp.]
MGLLSGLGDIFKQFSGSGTPANVEQHFDQVAQNVPASSLAGGLAEAFRSGETPPFAQMASQLFANGNGQQQANMLTTLMSSMGPEVISKFTGNNPSSPLTALLQSGQTQVSAEQAAQINPADVQTLAQHVEQHNPSIIDRVSEVYAAHPMLIKTLGAAAMAVAVKKIAEQHQG